MSADLEGKVRREFMTPQRWRALKRAFKTFLQHVGPHLAGMGMRKKEEKDERNKE